MTKLHFSLVLAVVLAGSSSNVIAQGRFKLSGEAAQSAPAPAAPGVTVVVESGKEAVPLTEDQKKVVEKIAVDVARREITAHTQSQAHLSNDQVVKLVRLEVPSQRVNDLWHYWLVFGLFVLLFLILLIGFRLPAKRARSTVHCLALLMISFTAAALQGASIDHCAYDNGGQPAFFVNDGTTSRVVCTGKDLGGIKIITFSDPAVTATNIVATPHLMKFDLAVGKSAAVGKEPDMLLDGKNDGNHIAVMSPEWAGETDYILRLTGGRTSSSFSGNDPMFRAWAKAQIEFYCAKGCSGKPAAEIYKLAIGTQKGSTAEAFRILEAARLKAIKEAVFADDRFVKAASTATVAVGSSFDPRLVYAELGKVQTAVQQVVGVQNDQGQRLANVENVVVGEQKQRAVDQRSAFQVKKLAEQTAAGVLGLKATPKPAKCAIWDSLREMNPGAKMDPKVLKEFERTCGVSPKMSKSAKKM